MPNSTQAVLNATSTNGRLLKLNILSQQMTDGDIADGLNTGQLEMTTNNSAIVDNQGHIVAEIDGIEEDASGTEFSNFSTQNESCQSLDSLTDTSLAQHINALRGFIDGQDDDLAELLNPHLGFMLAEQAKRARQR